MHTGGHLCIVVVVYVVIQYSAGLPDVVFAQFLCIAALQSAILYFVMNVYAYICIILCRGVEQLQCSPLACIVSLLICNDVKCAILL
jgi:hypothetical protein